MVRQLKLGDVAVDVVLKDIKNIHLSVYPPTGRVRIAAPLRMNLDTIRVFAISKLGWIKKHQGKIRNQEREPPREYLDRESHYLWGRRYLLKIVELEAAPKVELKHRTLLLQVRPGTSRDAMQAILSQWYRDQIKAAMPVLLAKWQPIIGVQVSRFHVQRMKTKWGSCSPVARSIRLNTELAKKPRDCLEYIVVHEMMHLLAPTHSQHFQSLMSEFMPRWQHHRKRLNRLPVSQEDWG
ncbi:MAG: M48 family metallopeptidase [Alphaproteobacteria bacterium]|nr:M48 family metallopeptidase [Alphaproteobacteria bacterium]